MDQLLTIGRDGRIEHLNLTQTNTHLHVEVVIAFPLGAVRAAANAGEHVPSDPDADVFKHFVTARLREDMREACMRANRIAQAQTETGCALDARARQNGLERRPGEPDADLRAAIVRALRASLEGRCEDCGERKGSRSTSWDFCANPACSAYDPTSGQR